MPYTRPTLSDLRSQVAQDISAALPGADALLRFSNLNITGVAQANLANLHYGYLDWIALQANPFTATDEYLEGWAALKGIYRKGATSATGKVTFSATSGSVIAAGTTLVRGDGATASTLDDAVEIGGRVTVRATITADPAGSAGAFGNAAVGVVMSLSQAHAGIQANGVVSVAFTGGADIEKDDPFRSRMLEAYQSTPQGGDRSDYVGWAKEVPGVTRAWCSPNSFGAGTVVVYVMFDNANAAQAGFPQGGNGVASEEPRAVAANGDQLVVANHIFPVQPVTALVYVVAPLAAPVNFSLSGVPVAKQDAVRAALADVFFRTGKATGGSTPIAFAWSAIAAVAGVSDFVIVAPTTDIINAAGTLPTVGVITYL
ncbi:phage baseplate protein [Janthinobacterium sp. BJB1]|nr:phage baseplate protein [Janthinobacterium sp. BJB1]